MADPCPPPPPTVTTDTDTDDRTTDERPPRGGTTVSYLPCHRTSTTSRLRRARCMAVEYILAAVEALPKLYHPWIQTACSVENDSRRPPTTRRAIAHELGSFWSPIIIVIGCSHYYPEWNSRESASAGAAAASLPMPISVCLWGNNNIGGGDSL